MKRRVDRLYMRYVVRVPRYYPGSTYWLFITTTILLLKLANTVTKFSRYMYIKMVHTKFSTGAQNLVPVCLQPVLNLIPWGMRGSKLHCRYLGTNTSTRVGRSYPPTAYLVPKPNHGNSSYQLVTRVNLPAKCSLVERQVWSFGVSFDQSGFSKSKSRYIRAALLKSGSVFSIDLG